MAKSKTDTLSHPIDWTTFFLSFCLFLPFQLFSCPLEIDIDVFNEEIASASTTNFNKWVNTKHWTWEKWLWNGAMAISNYNYGGVQSKHSVFVAASDVIVMQLYVHTVRLVAYTIRRWMDACNLNCGATACNVYKSIFQFFTLLLISQLLNHFHGTRSCQLAWARTKEHTHPMNLVFRWFVTGISHMSITYQTTLINSSRSTLIKQF